MMYPWYGWSGWGQFSFLPMTFFWLIFILICLWVMRCRHDHGHGEMPEVKTPLDILKERYAKGEIDKKEFEEKKADLSN